MQRKSPVRAEAEIAREYGPFEDAERVHGVTFDGASVWFATDGRIQSFDPDTGDAGASLDVAADAGTAFDGTHLYQLANARIQKIGPKTGEVLAVLPALDVKTPAGLTWAEGSLWIGSYRDRSIHQVDPETGKTLRTIASTHFVTGVTFVDGELWHGVQEEETSELRRIAPDSGEVLTALVMPKGKIVSGLESNGRDLFYCGGGTSGRVRAVRRR